MDYRDMGIEPQVALGLVVEQKENMGHFVEELVEKGRGWLAQEISQSLLG
jgi:hypothetical protein